MKRVVLTVALLCLCLPALSFAQDDTQTCFGCNIGIFDEDQLLHNYGFWDVTPQTPSKKFYIGIKYDPMETFDGLTGVEFSILGLPATFLAPTVTILNGGIKFGDNIQTPPDTTAQDAMGGWNIVWSECQPGERVLVEITLISFDPIPEDTVIRVLRKFPPSNPTTPNALFTICNFPLFSKVLSGAGCYVLNPSGGPVDCTITSVQKSTWSTIKELYR